MGARSQNECALTSRKGWGQTGPKSTGPSKATGCSQPEVDSSQFGDI